MLQKQTIPGSPANYWLLDPLTAANMQWTVTPMNFFEAQPWLLIPFIVITTETWTAFKQRLNNRRRRRNT